MHYSRALGMVLLLAIAPIPARSGTKTDLYGDPLPAGAVARLGTVRLRHPDSQTAFSKDGKRLLSCGRDGEVRVWDAATGKLLERKRLPWGPKLWLGEHLELSPDGSTAAVCREKTLSLWDTASGKERGQIPTNLVRFCNTSNFTSDGKELAVEALEGDKLTVQLWDALTIKKIRTLSLPSEGVLSELVLTPDGRRLAGVIFREFDTEGKLIVAQYDLALWDAAKGRLIGWRKNFPQRITALTISPDGKTLAVTTIDGEGASLLDAANFKQKALLHSPVKLRACFHYLSLSPDGRWLAASHGLPFIARFPQQRGFLLWDLTGAREVRNVLLPSWPRLAFAPDGKTLACSDIHLRSRIRLFDTVSGQPLLFRSGHDRPASTLAVSADGKMIASADDDGMLHSWSAATQRPIRLMEDCEVPIVSCSFSADGKEILSVGRSQHGPDFPTCRGLTLRVWDASTGRMLRRASFRKEFIHLRAVQLSPDGKRLAAIVSDWRNYSVQQLTWNAATGERLDERSYRLERRGEDKSDGHSSTWNVLHTAIAPDAASLTAWRGDRVGIEEIATGCLLALLPNGVGETLRYSPDGRLLAAKVLKRRKNTSSSEDFTAISLFEAASGEEILHLEPEDSESFVIAPDGRTLIAADRKSLRVWNIDTGEKWHQMDWPKEMGAFPHTITLFALPGGLVATGMDDGNILIWDLTPATWPKPEQMPALDRKTRDALWSDLAKDARSAHRAMHTLAAAPAQVVPYLRDHLQAVSVDGKAIENLLADLDGDSFPARQAALRELARLHYRIEPLLRRALQSKPSLEMRRRIEAILSGPKRPLPDDLRMLRAIAVLERIGTPEARAVLEKLSKGAPARATQEAQAALHRVKHR